MQEKCAHCLAEINPADFVADAQDQTRIFCCPACREIFKIIRGSGLDSFYRKRADWQPGPPEQTTVRPELFADLIQRDNGNSRLDLQLDGIRCASCVWLIERFLSRLKGICDIRISRASHKAVIVWDPAQIDLAAILSAIISLGYAPRTYNPSWQDSSLELEKRDLLIRFATAAFFTLQIMLFSVVLYEGFFREIDRSSLPLLKLVLWFLATPVVFYSGYPFLANACRGLKNNLVTMDTLVFLGSFSAYGYSVFALLIDREVYFDTACMIITLILLGRLLEVGMRRKASEALTALAGLQPKEARLVEEGMTRKVLLQEIRVNDLIEVLPGDIFPLDGKVLEGHSEVDESALTGEAMPVAKTTGAEVLAGTQNLNGRMIVRVTRPNNDTLLAKVIRSVEDSQTAKAGMQRLADRTIGWFVPAILLIALSTLLFRLSHGEDVASALMNAVAVLVIACPCAMGLATPMAILAGSSEAAKFGILLRGGDVLESAAAIDRIFFDKTGTLTEGRPEIVESIAYNMEITELRRLAASLEKGSEHPLARALLTGIPDHELYPLAGFKANPGAGVEGIVRGVRVWVGNPGLITKQAGNLSSEQLSDLKRLTAAGHTVVGLVAAGELKGWLALTDPIRSEAAQMVVKIAALKIPIAILTGDTAGAALRVSRAAGMVETGDDHNDFGKAGLTPSAKAEELKLWRHRGKKIMMVGDGINDAPALSEAAVGVAMGGATDIALKSAGVVLLRNDLTMVPELIIIGRRTRRRIRQNLFWAFSYNLVAVPLAVTGTIHPVFSAALMAASSLLVLANSLRSFSTSKTLFRSMPLSHRS